MGLPIKHRKKYISHKKRWDKATIEQEAVLVRDYALKNKKEIRKVELEISKLKKIAKSLNRNAQTKESKEAGLFIETLKKKGFISAEASSLDEVLDINLRTVLDRRLSNIIYKNKLARTPSQARQFIVHRHVMVADKVINSPSYFVSLAEEEKITFIGTSSLSDENHPERKLAAGGLAEELEILEKTPLNKSNPSFDKKEEILEEQELDEVNK